MLYSQILYLLLLANTLLLSVWGTSVEIICRWHRPRVNLQFVFFREYDIFVSAHATQLFVLQFWSCCMTVVICGSWSGNQNWLLGVFADVLSCTIILGLSVWSIFIWEAFSVLEAWFKLGTANTWILMMMEGISWADNNQLQTVSTKLQTVSQTVQLDRRRFQIQTSGIQGSLKRA